jgi:hypothetical protein
VHAATIPSPHGRPGARLITGHADPRRKRRHGQHTPNPAAQATPGACKTSEPATAGHPPSQPGTLDQRAAATATRAAHSPTRRPRRPTRQPPAPRWPRRTPVSWPPHATKTRRLTRNCSPGRCLWPRRQVNQRTGSPSLPGARARSRTVQDTSSPPTRRVSVQRSGQPSLRSSPEASVDGTGTSKSSQPTRCDHSGPAPPAPQRFPSLTHHSKAHSRHHHPSISRMGAIGLFIWARIGDPRQRSFVTGYPGPTARLSGLRRHPRPYACRTPPASGRRRPDVASVALSRSVIARPAWRAPSPSESERNADYLWLSRCGRRGQAGDRSSCSAGPGAAFLPVPMSARADRSAPGPPRRPA